LRRHIHLHVVMACGTLTPEGHWSAPRRKPDFLFPVHALSKVFRGKFMAALTSARHDGKLERDPQGSDAAGRERHRQLYKHDWVVYAKTPMGGPAQVLEYLSRYTHRTAIGNERIRAVDAQQVAFTARADAHGGKRMVRLEGSEFVRRFLLHILPTGIKRIRHYGILAPACKKNRLSAARLALEMPVINPQALESALAFMSRVAMIDVGLCRTCKNGQLRVIATLPGPRRLPAPGDSLTPQSRGPP
jgi:hypothetical protein